MDPDTVNISGGDILQKSFEVNYNKEDNNYTVTGSKGTNHIHSIEQESHSNTNPN